MRRAGALEASTAVSVAAGSSVQASSLIKATGSPEDQFRGKVIGTDHISSSDQVKGWRIAPGEPSARLLNAQAANECLYERVRLVEAAGERGPRLMTAAPSRGVVRPTSNNCAASSCVIPNHFVRSTNAP